MILAGVEHSAFVTKAWMVLVFLSSRLGTGTPEQFSCALKMQCRRVSLTRKGFRARDEWGGYGMGSLDSLD
jgi:hypothetical protein